MGAEYVVALKNDGTLWSWGYNALGGLGNGTSANQFLPTQVGTDNNWAKIAAGAYHTIAIKNDGTLWSWGGNFQGELGYDTGSSIAQNTPIQIGASIDWSKIIAGTFHTIAIKNDGSLWAWGGNARGQLGDGTTVNKNTPIQIGNTTDWTNISGGGFHTLALTSNNFLYTCGANDYLQLGNESSNDSNILVNVNCSNLKISDYDLDKTLSVFPNPTNGNFTILSKTAIISSISIYDLQGRMVLKNSLNSEVAQMDISSLESATYIIKVASDKSIELFKIIKY